MTVSYEENGPCSDIRLSLKNKHSNLFSGFIALSLIAYITVRIITVNVYDLSHSLSSHYYMYKGTTPILNQLLNY